MERSAKLVDRVIKSKLGICIDVLLHRLRQCSKKFAVVGGGGCQVVGMVKGELAGREFPGMMSSA